MQENIYLLNHANYFISEIILKDIPYFLSESQEDINKKYTDITKTIINFNPIGLRNNNGHLSEDESILTCLNLINEDGMGIFYYPSFIRFKNRLFRKITENEYFVNSIINLPESFNSPCTALKGILLFISRVETPNIYFSEFDTLEPNISQIEHVANEVISQLNFDFSTGFPASYEVVAKDMFDDSLNNDEVDEIEDLWHGVRRSFNDFKSFEYFT